MFLRREHHRLSAEIKQSGANAAGATSMASKRSFFIVLGVLGTHRVLRASAQAHFEGNDIAQPSRLAEIRHIHAQFRSKVPAEYIQVSDPRDNDSVANQLRTGSLVVNATGLGKDAPGSPLTDAARFPANGIVWELNYRGDLVFVRQANAQKIECHLQIEDAVGRQTLQDQATTGGYAHGATILGHRGHALGRRTQELEHSRMQGCCNADLGARPLFLLERSSSYVVGLASIFFVT